MNGHSAHIAPILGLLVMCASGCPGADAVVSPEAASGTAPASAQDVSADAMKARSLVLEDVVALLDGGSLAFKCFLDTGDVVWVRLVATLDKGLVMPREVVLHRGFQGDGAGGLWENSAGTRLHPGSGLEKHLLAMLASAAVVLPQGHRDRDAIEALVPILEDRSAKMPAFEVWRVRDRVRERLKMFVEQRINKRLQEIRARETERVRGWGELRVGMTREEVSKILGKPAATCVLRDEIGEHQLSAEMLAAFRDALAKQQYEMWTYDSSNGTSAVVFDGTNMPAGHSIWFDHEGRIKAIGQEAGR